MKEGKTNFFQWFINMLRMDRKNYEATKEEKDRVYNKIVENLK